MRIMGTLRCASPDDAGLSVEGLMAVDRLIREAVGHAFPAAVVLIARKGVVAFHRAYGYMDPEVECRPTPTHAIFDLASITKLFTTTAFMCLVQKGLASLSLPVADVLSEFSGRRPLCQYR